MSPASAAGAVKTPTQRGCGHSKVGSRPSWPTSCGPRTSTSRPCWTAGTCQLRKRSVTATGGRNRKSHDSLGDRLPFCHLRIQNAVSRRSWKKRDTPRVVAYATGPHDVLNYFAKCAIIVWRPISSFRPTDPVGSSPGQPGGKQLCLVPKPNDQPFRMDLADEQLLRFCLRLDRRISRHPRRSRLTSQRQL